MWSRRLDDAFVSEMNQHMLKVKYKGPAVYTDKGKNLIWAIPVSSIATQRKRAAIRHPLRILPAT